MTKKLTLEWLRAALIRAAKTIAQTALGMLTVGAAFEDIQWIRVVSVALVAGVISILTSIATNLPEVGSEGTLLVDTSNPDKDKYRLVLDAPLETFNTAKTVRIVIDPKANLS